MASTIKDVAKKAGVGVGTVSRVINGGKNVRDSTRKHVLTVIKELDFQPNPIAQRLSLGKTNTIGVIAPFFTTPSCVERLRGIESILVDTELDFMLYNVETLTRRRKSFKEVPRPERVDGLLIITLIPTNEEIDRFERNNIPTVLVDQAHERLPYLAVNDVEGGRIATQHLIDLGHREIAFISDHLDDPLQDPFEFTSARDRFTGYRHALAEANIPFRSDYHKRGPHEKKYAYELAKELLTQDDKPTAIFATSDTQAIGALQAAQDLGLSVPEDVSIIGYDDIEVSQYLNVTTVRQPLFQSGVEGIQLLLERMEKPAGTLRQRKMPVELIVRNTTAPPKVVST